MGALIPSAAERCLLGRFYLATVVSELAHLAMPFQVLFMVRYLGEMNVGWVLLAERSVGLLAEIPTGALADRFGRKLSVLAGHAIAGLGWLCIPGSTLAPQSYWLPLVCLAFSVVAAGHALTSGAFESWVVDDLRAAGRRDLILSFFGRERSLASTAGVVADVVALYCVSQALFDFRWFFVMTALGEWFALAILATQSEAPFRADHYSSSSATGAQTGKSEWVFDADDPQAEELEELEAELAGAEGGVIETARRGWRNIVQHPSLIALAAILFWSVLTLGSGSEAIQTVFSEAHEAMARPAQNEEHDFALLELGSDVLGMAAPLAAVWLVTRLGTRRVMALGVLLPAMVSLAMYWTGGQIGAVAAAFLITTSMYHVFQTAADEYQHRLLDSTHRATTSSAFNLLTGLAGAFSGALIAGLFHWFSPAVGVACLGVLALPCLVLLLPRWFAQAEVEDVA
ncbi:MAG: MFS transporter [Planctomycetes bacterium]|nr:MFS transporter [Planctomycetota bacterium]